MHAQFMEFMCVTALAGPLSEVALQCDDAGHCAVVACWRAAERDMVRVSQQQRRDTENVWPQGDTRKVTYQRR